MARMTNLWAKRRDPTNPYANIDGYRILKAYATREKELTDPFARWLVAVQVRGGGWSIGDMYVKSICPITDAQKQVLADRLAAERATAGKPADTKPQPESPPVKADDPPFDTVGFVMDFETGALDEDAIVAGFVELIRRGILQHLQGTYHRTARLLYQYGKLSAIPENEIPSWIKVSV